MIYESSLLSSQSNPSPSPELEQFSDSVQLQQVSKFPPNNLSIFIPNKEIISNTSSLPSPPHYPHQLIMVLTSSACFWFSTSSSLILWSFKLLRPKICQSWPCFLTHGAQHRIVNPKKVTSLEPLAHFSSPPFLKRIF